MHKKFYSLNLPVKPYLKKYIQSLYGVAELPGTPVVFSTDNYFGTTLLGYLTTRTYLLSTKRSHKSFDKFEDTITILMPRHWLLQYQYRTQLAPCNIVFINKHFEERFEEDVARYCHYLSLSGIEIKQALEDFCKIHSIEIDEDITYEALKKKEYRHRKFFEQNLWKSDLVKQKNFQPSFF